MKYCQYCGSEINDNAVVCVKCGCSVVALKTKKKSSHNYFLIFGIISLILSAISAGIASYLNSTALSGNAVAFLRTFGDSASIRAYELHENLQLVFAYSFLILLFLGLVLLVVGIVKKIRSK